MKLYVETCNLVFDSEDPRCRLIRSRSQGADFVFVQCLDVGIGRGFAAAREKELLGRV